MLLCQQVNRAGEEISARSPAETPQSAAGSFRLEQLFNTSHVSRDGVQIRMVLLSAL